MWIIRPLLLAVFIRIDFIYEWAYSVAQWLHIPVSYTFITHTGAFVLMAAIVLIYNFVTYDKYVFTKQNQRNEPDLKS
jgi:hypothetical protein